jgi:hypothetical protein
VNKKYITWISITSLIGLGALIAYFNTFNGALELNHQRWGEFGSFFGGVISPLVAILAFITVLYNFDLSKSQFKKNNENSTFFSLIDLHGRKVDSIAFVENNKPEIKNFHAFKAFTSVYNDLIDSELVHSTLVRMAKDPSNLSNNEYEILWNNLAVFYLKDTNPYIHEDTQNLKIINFFNRTKEDNWEIIKTVIGTGKYIKPENYEQLKRVGLIYIMDAKSEIRVKFLQTPHEIFYKEYGHVLGHYFRNVHYILDHIDSVSESKKYAQIFRAQFSRYELALLYYNALSPMSSEIHVKLLSKYDIFNGLYPYDIFYSPTQKQKESDLKYREGVK